MRFEQVYVVSDLHFGGSERKIFAGEKEFPWFVEQLTEQAQTKSTALVINGDFIDFLAIDTPQPPAYFDPDFAIEKLRATLRDIVFNESFSALAKFTKAAQAKLIINLGNHDLELFLPEVQAEFIQELDMDSRHVIWVTDGSGVRLQVGRADILCLHGNEVDEDNFVDFDMLRYIKLCRNAGVYKERALDQWIPNMGTQLVIDAMNNIKQVHPFVDLLKPEIKAAIPALISVDRTLTKQSLKPGAIAFVQGTGRTWLNKNLAPGRRVLSVDQTPPQGPGNFVNSPYYFATADATDAAQLLAQADQDFNSNLKALDLIELQSQGMQTLGFVDWAKFFWAKLRGENATEQLRHALSDLMHDTSFEEQTADTMNRDLQAKIKTNVHFLCSGHTHFRRSLRTGTQSHHYNSGTWAYLMRLKPELLSDPVAFSKFHQLLANVKQKDGQAMGADIDTLLEKGYAFKQLTAIHIAVQENGVVRGRLLEYVLENDQVSFKSDPRFVRDIKP